MLKISTPIVVSSWCSISVGHRFWVPAPKSGATYYDVIANQLLLKDFTVVTLLTAMVTDDPSPCQSRMAHYTPNPVLWGRRSPAR